MLKRLERLVGEGRGIWRRAFGVSPPSHFVDKPCHPTRKCCGDKGSDERDYCYQDRNQINHLEAEAIMQPYLVTQIEAQLTESDLRFANGKLNGLYICVINFSRSAA